MEMRRLGRSGLYVSALGYGAMTFGSGAAHRKANKPSYAVGTTDVATAKRLVDICFEAGVNLFDTANSYSKGQSEEILGQALIGKRQAAIIATKGYGSVGSSLNDLGGSRRYLIQACEDSLRRLRTDYIDLYQLHQFDELTPLDETLRACDDLVRAGKVRYVGVSNYSASQLMKAVHLSERHGWQRVISQQIYYSLAAREAEWEMLPVSRDEDVGVLVWGPLAFGLLSGKFRRGSPMPEGARASIMGGPGSLAAERVYDVVEALDVIAKERGVTIAQVALNYIMQNSTVSSVLIGARDEKQLRENLSTSSWGLAAEERETLSKISAAPLPYPYWHMATYGAARNPTYAKLLTTQQMN